MTLNQEEIVELCEAYRKYGTLREVSKRFARSPNTVKKYASQQMDVKIQNIVKSINCKYNRLIGIYVGLWLGDGTQYYDRGYTIKICCNKEDKILNKFVQDIILRVFNKKTLLIESPSTKQAYIKFKSKFVFEFIFQYITHKLKSKTGSVRLKEDVESYDSDFLEGCLLGLSLSDGFLKGNFRFNVVSFGLAENMLDILRIFGLNPSIYVHRRLKYGWKDLHMVRLNIEESKKLGSLFDKTLKEIGCLHSFKELKYGPAQI